MTDPELQRLQELAREVVEIWREGPSQHDYAEMDSAMGELARALPPEPQPCPSRSVQMTPTSDGRLLRARAAGKVSDQSQICGEFIEWLEGHDLYLCEPDRNSMRDRYWPTHKPIRELLAAFFDIDLRSASTPRRKRCST